MRESYAPIFDALDIENAPRSQIHAEFIRKYPSLGDPGRGVTCFLTLCSYADIQLAAQRRSAGTGDKPKRGGSPSPRADKVAPKPPKPQRERTQRQPRGGTSPITGQVTINAEIPADWTTDQIRERLAAIADALKETGLR